MLGGGILDTYISYRTTRSVSGPRKGKAIGRFSSVSGAKLVLIAGFGIDDTTWFSRSTFDNDFMALSSSKSHSVSTCSALSGVTTATSFSTYE